MLYFSLIKEKEFILIDQTFDCKIVIMSNMKQAEILNVIIKI